MTPSDVGRLKKRAKPIKNAAPVLREGSEVVRHPQKPSDSNRVIRLRHGAVDSIKACSDLR
jgi:hypothetical protein